PHPNPPPRAGGGAGARRAVGLSPSPARGGRPGWGRFPRRGRVAAAPASRRQPRPRPWLTPMLWACVLLPQLALDDVLRRLPDPGAPLALVTGPAQLRTLHAVNASAAHAGLRAGMRLTAARALLRDFTMVEHDPQAEARCQRFLAAWAYRHSSLVSAQWPGCIVLEVRASFRLLGPWPKIEARLRAELAAL